MGKLDKHNLKDAELNIKRKMIEAINNPLLQFFSMIPYPDIIALSLFFFIIKPAHSEEDIGLIFLYFSSLSPVGQGSDERSGFKLSLSFFLFLSLSLSISLSFSLSLSLCLSLLILTISFSLNNFYSAIVTQADCDLGYIESFYQYIVSLTSAPFLFFG